MHTSPRQAGSRRSVAGENRPSRPRLAARPRSRGRCALVLALAVSATDAAAQRPGATLIVNARDAVSGTPLANALITVHGTDLLARTDTAGRGRIGGVPEGIHLVSVRLIGHGPRTIPLPFMDGDTVDVAISLVRFPAYLPPVRAVARAYSPWLREFEQRRVRGVGRFITEAEIRASSGSNLGALLMTRVPGVRVGGPDQSIQHVYSLRGPNSLGGQCQAAVYLDGVRVPTGNAGEVSLSQLAGIEYHTPNTAPVQYRQPSLVGYGGLARDGSAACGVLLLWTRP